MKFLRSSPQSIISLHHHPVFKQLTLLLLALMWMLAAAGLARARQAEGSLHSWPVAALDGDQIEADVAYNPDDDNFLLVFTSHQGATWSVYGQVLDSEGYVTMPLTPLATGGGEERHHPAVAYNSHAGEFLVVWEETFLGQDWDIRGIRVTSEGVALGDPFPVAARTNPERQPDVVWDSVNNRYLVVWRQTVGEMTDVSGQFLNGLGQSTGADFPITFSAAEERRPRVAFDAPTGRYMVVWEESVGGDTNVRGQVLDRDGNWLGNVIAVAANPWAEASPVLAAGRGQFLAVWSEAPNSDHRDIMAQRFQTTGAAAGSKLTLASGAHDIFAHPAVAYNASKDAWLVVWDFAVGDNDRDILGRYVGSDGSMLGNELVIGSNSYVQGHPAAVAGNQDNYLTVWEEIRNGASDLYAAMVGPQATPEPTPPAATLWLPLVKK